MQVIMFSLLVMIAFHCSNLSPEGVDYPRGSKWEAWENGPSCDKNKYRYSKFTVFSEQKAVPGTQTVPLFWDLPADSGRPCLLLAPMLRIALMNHAPPPVPDLMGSCQSVTIASARACACLVGSCLPP